MTSINRYDEPKLISALAYEEESQKYPAGVLILKGSRAIRAGDALSKDIVNSTGDRDVLKVVKSTSLRISLSSTTQKSIWVEDAHAFVVGDEIKIGALTAQTCTGIDYDRNRIDFATAPGTIQAPGIIVRVPDNNQDHAVAIAALPLVDKNAYKLSGNINLVTPRDRDVFYGSAYIRGVFWLDVLVNGHFHNGDPIDLSLGGRRHHKNNTYIIDRVSADYEG